jgi:hypothetical protein
MILMGTFFCGRALSAPRLPEGLSEKLFKEYKALNDQEERYGDYKDSDAMLAAKLVQLAHINKSRKKHGVPRLKLDILASRVANRQAREACEHDFSGHWNMRGEKPYHRYAFAGGTDHVAENAWAKRTTGKFPFSVDTCMDYMKEAHDGFMAEKPPDDGHKKTVIRKEHNYVGLGCHLTTNQFRYYEEYIDRYLDFQSVKTEAVVNERFFLEVKPLRNDHFVYAVAAFYEPFPEPMTPDQLNRKGSYPDYTPHRPLSLWPWELERNRRTGAYTFPLQFSKAGIYYIHIYLSNKPFKGSRADTTGKTQASGLVVKVDER